MRPTPFLGLAIAAGLALPSSALHAQESEGTSEAYEHLKALEWVVGDWTCELPSPEGQPLRIDLKVSWLHDKEFLRVELPVYSGDQLVETSEVTYFWDPTKQEIRVFGIGSDGGWWRGAIETGDKMYRPSTDGVDGDGKPVSGSVVVKRTGEDSITGQFVDQIVAGEPQPDSPVYMFHRK